MSWDEFNRQLDRGPAYATFAMWRWLILILVLAGITVGGIWVVSRPFVVVGGTLNTDNVKYNYEWFKQTHEDVLSLDKKIIHAEQAVEQFKKDAGPRNAWHREDREEYSRLNAVLQGLKDQRSDVVANYNARSRMVNRAIFKGTDTPTRIR